MPERLLLTSGQGKKEKGVSEHLALTSNRPVRGPTRLNGTHHNPE